MARTKESEMKKQKAAAGRVSKSSHGNHHDLDVDMIEKKLGKKVTVRKKCSYEDCTTNARSKGLCTKHGGGTRCKHEGCTKLAQRGGLCDGHGGTRSVQVRKPCQFEGCSTLAHSKGFCKKHGGGTRCRVDGCDKGAQRDGLCWGCLLYTSPSPRD